MAITANKKLWTEFIEIYHSLPSLWNTKDENYNNRESRSVAWNKLVEKLREVEPDANQDSVKRKINTFRSNFNREVRKIRQTQKEQPNEVYKPSLWYFDRLSFLLNQEKYSANNASIDSHYSDEEMTLMGLCSTKTEIIDENETMTAECTTHQEDITQKQPEYNTNEKLLTNELSSRLGGRRNKVTGPEPKRFIELTSTPEPKPTELSTTETSSLAVTEDSLLELEGQEGNGETERTSLKLKTLSTGVIKRSKFRLKSQNPYQRNTLFTSLLTDEATIYGQSWACSFRKLSPQQKLFAKKAIDEILILGQLKALKLHTIMELGGSNE